MKTLITHECMHGFNEKAFLTNWTQLIKFKQWSMEALIYTMFVCELHKKCNTNILLFHIDDESKIFWKCHHLRYSSGWDVLFMHMFLLLLLLLLLLLNQIINKVNNLSRHQLENQNQQITLILPALNVCWPVTVSLKQSATSRLSTVKN